MVNHRNSRIPRPFWWLRWLNLKGVKRSCYRAKAARIGSAKAHELALFFPKQSYHLNPQWLECWQFIRRIYSAHFGPLHKTFEPWNSIFKQFSGRAHGWIQVRSSMIRMDCRVRQAISGFQWRSIWSLIEGPRHSEDGSSAMDSFSISGEVLIRRGCELNTQNIRSTKGENCFWLGQGYWFGGVDPGIGGLASYNSGCAVRRDKSGGQANCTIINNLFKGDELRGHVIPGVLHSVSDRHGPAAFFYYGTWALVGGVHARAPR